LPSKSIDILILLSIGTFRRDGRRLKKCTMPDLLNRHDSQMTIRKRGFVDQPTMESLDAQI
jgi:hypothetical protein